MGGSFSTPEGKGAGGDSRRSDILLTFQRRQKCESSNLVISDVRDSLVYVEHVALLLWVGGSQEQRPGRERAGWGGSGIRDWDLSQELRAWAVGSNSRPDTVSPVFPGLGRGLLSTPSGALGGVPGGPSARVVSKCLLSHGALVQRHPPLLFATLGGTACFTPLNLLMANPISQWVWKLIHRKAA